MDVAKKDSSVMDWRKRLLEVGPYLRSAARCLTTNRGPPWFLYGDLWF